MNKNIFILQVVAISCLCSCKFANNKKSPFILADLGENVCIHTEDQEKFALTGEFDTEKYKGVQENSRPTPVELSWTIKEGYSFDSYKIYVSENKKMKDPWIFESDTNEFDLYNCKIDTQYYWRVESGKEYSSISTFKTSDTPIRNLYIDGVTNCRDLGGYKTADGKEVKQGLIFRTAAYNNTALNKTDPISPIITKKGADTFLNQLNLKTEIDLRGSEIEAGNLNGKSIIPGVNYHFCKMVYKDDVVYPNKASIKEIFNNILSEEKSYPLSFHCAIGTDRTGMLAYTILGLCGVEESYLLNDYLFSNFASIGSKRNLIDIRNKYLLLYSDARADTLSAKIEKVLVEMCDVDPNAIAKMKKILVG